MPPNKKWIYVPSSIKVGEARKKGTLVKQKVGMKIFNSFEEAEVYRKKNKITKVKSVPVSMPSQAALIKSSKKVGVSIKEVLSEAKKGSKHYLEWAEKKEKELKKKTSKKVKFSGKGVHRNRSDAQSEMSRWENKGYKAEIRNKRLAGELAYQVYIKPRTYNVSINKKFKSRSEAEKAGFKYDHTVGLFEALNKEKKRLNKEGFNVAWVIKKPRVKDSEADIDILIKKK